MRFVRASLILTGLIAIAQPLSAQTAEGKFMVRVRALSLTPANKSDAIPSLSVAADKITVSDKIFPEIDLSYFFTKRFAAELVLTYPQKHDVKLNDTKIGTFYHLPPTLLAQFHLVPDGVVRPYIGAGVNFTLLMKDDIAVTGVGPLTLSEASVGAAGQVGVDIKVRAGQFLNIDVKKVMIGSDVKAGGVKVSQVHVDPLLVSIGYGIRF